MERCCCWRRLRLAARSPGAPAPNSLSNRRRGLGSGATGWVGERVAGAGRGEGDAQADRQTKEEGAEGGGSEGVGRRVSGEIREGDEERCVIDVAGGAATVQAAEEEGKTDETRD